MVINVLCLCTMYVSSITADCDLEVHVEVKGKIVMVGKELTHGGNGIY